ncbi:histidinol phosphate phosphatase [Paraburkholderia sp. UYCP14C]|nr:histidinol phosphate phosphatase [Paraburkholderia sp. UYCP14C]
MAFPHEILPFVDAIADEARSLACAYFRSGANVNIKVDGSPVTQADVEIEAALRRSIAKQYPLHSILGEESGGQIGDGWSWALDPIDGTKSFVCGVPLFGTLIALLHERRPLLGVIDMPILGERWLGYGDRTTWNGIRVETSTCSTLADARMFSTAPEMFDPASAAAFEQLSEVVAMRRFGTDCYAYGLLASGYVDLVVEAGLKLYDVLALVPVIEAAGGIITDWKGERLGTAFDGRVIAAATAELHHAALNVVNASLNAGKNGSPGGVPGRS